jgi:hypothetical protein
MSDELYLYVLSASALFTALVPFQYTHVQSTGVHFVKLPADPCNQVGWSGHARKCVPSYAITYQQFGLFCRPEHVLLSMSCSNKSHIIRLGSGAQRYESGVDLRGSETVGAQATSRAQEQLAFC